MKKWLYDRFLPMWARQSVMADNRKLRQENQLLQQKILQLEHYIRGMDHALRRIRHWKPHSREGEV